jgi:hypothetical protein
MYRITTLIAALFRVALIGALYSVSKLNGSDENLGSALEKWAAVFRWGLGPRRETIRMNGN